MNVLVRGADGVERPAVVKTALGQTVRVRFADSSIDDVHASAVRRPPPREP
jgi:hypothetical protein